MGKLINESGNHYGRLVVTSRAANIDGRAAWLCECECGKATGIIEEEHGKETE